jgi:hypothetical protein
MRDAAKLAHEIGNDFEAGSRLLVGFDFVERVHRHQK